MVTPLYVIAFVMVLGGLGVLVRGAPFIGVDWGNTLILAGIVAACSGALLAGLAAALGALKGIARELAEAREHAFSSADPSSLFGEAAGLRPTQLGPEPAHSDVEAGTHAGPLHGEAFAPIRAAATAVASLPPDAGLDEAVPTPVQLSRTEADPRPPAPSELEPSGRAVPEFLTRPRAPGPAHDPYREPQEPGLAQAASSTPAGEATAAIGRRPHGSAGEVRDGSVHPVQDDWPEALPPGAETSPHEDPREAGSGHGSAVPRDAAAVESVAGGDAEKPTGHSAEPPPAHEIGRYSSGGNSYVMFADGSIEAETPNGNFRFGSLDELKRFIASGGERSASATG